MEKEKIVNTITFNIFDEAFEGVIIFDIYQKNIYWNHSFKLLLEFKTEDKNLSFSELFKMPFSFDQILDKSRFKEGFVTLAETFYGKKIILKCKFEPDNNFVIFFAKESTSADQNKNQFDKISKNACNLIEEAADSFFVIDKNFKILSVNTSACILTGYNKEELLNMSYVQLFSDIELFNKPFDRDGIENGRTIIFERKIAKKDNTQIDIETRTKKLSDGNFLSIARDINTRVEIRTQLEVKNKELERTYQQVIKSENRYKQLFKNLPLGIFTATENGTIESINYQMLEILGSDSAKTSLKFNLFELPSLKDTKLLQDFKSALFEGRSHYKLYEFTSIWNKKTYIKTHILPLEKDGTNKIMVIVEDYTKERENEMRMKILSQGVNNSPASIVVTNEEGKIIFVNKRFVEITGYSLNELINNKPSIIKSGYHNSEFYGNLWQTIRSGKEWVGEFLNKKKNGELYWESGMIAALKDENGVITNFMAIKEDITHKKQVEKELKEKTEQLLSLVNHTPDNICFKDENGQWILANTTTLKLFGLEGVEYQGKTNDELFYKSIRDNSFLVTDSKTDKAAWEKGSIYQYEAQFIDDEGKEIILEVLKLPLYHSDGNKRGIINIRRDITGRKIYEEELMIAKNRAEEADLLKSAFLANMSHEIRTPLNAIMGFSSLMADYSLDKESISKFLEIIQVNGRQLLNIIDDILLISKLQVNQIKVTTAVFDLDQVLSKLNQQFGRELSILNEKKIELSVEKVNVKSSVKIKTDRDKLSMIYSKLIRNAIKFTSKGKVQFGFELKGDNEIVFFVKDTGVGISKEKQDFVFKKFRQADDSTTREYGGTGLGLSIVKGLIDLLEGKLWVESELGQGAIFYFSLPLEIIEIESSVETNTKKKAQWGTKKIMIVDDVGESIFLLSEVLKSTGINIITAETGAQAIQKFIDNPDIDLILMDIQLPEINGLEAAVEIKKINPKVAIIVQTAYAQDGFTQKSKDAGCDDIVFKPINFENLIKKMHRFLSV